MTICLQTYFPAATAGITSGLFGTVGYGTAGFATVPAESSGFTSRLRADLALGLVLRHHDDEPPGRSGGPSLKVVSGGAGEGTRSPKSYAGLFPDRDGAADVGRHTGAIPHFLDQFAADIQAGIDSLREESGAPGIEAQIGCLEALAATLDFVRRMEKRDPRKFQQLVQRFREVRDVLFDRDLPLEAGIFNRLHRGEAVDPAQLVIPDEVALVHWLQFSSIWVWNEAGAQWSPRTIVLMLRHIDGMLEDDKRRPPRSVCSSRCGEGRYLEGLRVSRPLLLQILEMSRELNQG